MSAQEREALVRELVTPFGPGTFGSAGPELYEYEAERIADVLLAAGWTRSVSDEDVIERAAREMYHAAGFHAADTWESDMQARRDHYLEQARALAAAGLLASPVREPGRSEAEIRESVESDVPRKPSLWAEHDQDGEPDWDLSTLTASWDVSFGCRINFGPDPDGVLRVSVHVSDAAKRDGMARLPVTPDDLRQMAVYLNDVADRADQVTDTEGSK